MNIQILLAAIYLSKSIPLIQKVQFLYAFGKTINPSLIPLPTEEDK